ncbi:MAG: hypothetical protein ACR2NF_12220 [Pirellulales bacterium]
MRHKLHVRAVVFFFCLLFGFSQTAFTAVTDDDLWMEREQAFELDEIVTEASPLGNDPSSAASSSRGTNPFTYEENFYDRPRREWWWDTGKFTVVLVGGLVLTYCTVGLVAPWIGGTLGGMYGLSGAAAVSKGLAILGGGALGASSLSFGMAGGTFLVGVVTDLAISNALEYSLDAFDSEPQLFDLKESIAHLDANVDQTVAWEAVKRETRQALKNQADYTVVTHALATACMRLAAAENLDKTLETEDLSEEQAVLSIAGDRQQVLMLLALRLLDGAHRHEPSSSVIHHSLANAYWWLSVRGGFDFPNKVPESFNLPEGGQIKIGKAGDIDCQAASLWHFVSGAAAEPRNTNLRINWANSLQADGRGYQAIGVLAAALPTLDSLREEDKVRVLKNHAMLQYQAFTLTSGWDEAAIDDFGRKQIALGRAPHLLAALQAYSIVLEKDPRDLITLGSLLQINREVDFSRSGRPESILPELKVAELFIDAIVDSENYLEANGDADGFGKKKSGQLLQNYCQLVDYAFEKVMAKEYFATLKIKHRLLTKMIVFLNKTGIEQRPFKRKDCLSVYQSCKDYNKKTWLPTSKYDLAVLNKECKKKIEEVHDGNLCASP